MNWSLILIPLVSSASLAAAETCWPKALSPVQRAPSLVVIRATGIGHPPPRMKGAQALLMARRAAEVAAVRNLGRKLGLDSKARIGPFEYESTRRLADGRVEVTVNAVRRISTGRDIPKPSPRPTQNGP